MRKKVHILFVGGGTVGHISKCLAVMQAVQELAQKKGVELHLSYAGLASDVQSTPIRESALIFDRYEIAAGKFNRYLTWKHIPESYKFAKGLVQATRLVRKLSPDYIFAAGGYVTVPIALAASRLGIPLVTHETDVIPGLANGLAARSARRIFTAYPVSAYTTLPADKLQQVGQPVRPNFYTNSRLEEITLDGRRLAQPFIVVTGGSQGAHQLNVLTEKSWETILKNTQLVHVTGTRDYAELVRAASQLPEELQQKLWVISFIQDELPALFQQSELVISRAGGTFWELAATRTPVMLVPLSTAAQNHQEANAKVLEKAGAAIIFNETTGTMKQFATCIQEVVASKERQAELTKAIATFDRPNAAVEMAEFMLSGSISA